MREVKSVLRRFLTLALVLAMVMTLAPQTTLTVQAASTALSGLSDETIGLSFTKSGGDDPWTASGTTVSGSVKSTAGTCSDTAYNTTLTITNKRESAATLSFAYAVALNSGTIQVAGEGVTANGTYQKELASGDSINIYLKSGSTSAATTITLTALSLVADVSATTTFQPAENGSYTVDGTNITETTSKTQSSLTAYALVATPADGCQFLGWYDVTNQKYLSTDAKASLNIEQDCTLTAKFAQEGTAVFETGGQVYEDLDAAVRYAKEKSLAKITQIADGSLSGTHTIPAGITLLIPQDATNTLYTDTPETTEGDKGTRKAYRTLNLAENASLIVEGAISIGGWYKAAAGSAAGYMTGTYGLIKMADSSKITVKDGGALYAWGYVSGSGSVTVQSGGTAMEWYQITDFRGGSASMSVGNKVFPINQYYIQNVEVPMTLEDGATETAYTGVYAMSKINKSAIPLIGDNGLFKITSGSLTKAYDGSRDRQTYTIDGEMELNVLKLSLAGSSLDSSNYVLPITNNFSLNIASGKLTVKQKAALLPGVEIEVAKGAQMEVASGASLYVYDADEWGGYSGGYSSKFIAAPYAPSRTYNRSEAKDIVNAKIDVGGTLTATGSIYTTASGANICSSAGTGKYVMQNGAGSETKTYQYTQSGSSVTAHEIVITPAKLRNADDTYTETKEVAAGMTIPYKNGKWQMQSDVTVAFDANGGEGTIAAQTISPNTDTALTANNGALTKTGHTFDGWNTKADGSGIAYEDGATVNLSEDITLYAQWKANTYTVTWVDENGAELEKDENVAYGTTPSYDGETPTKVSDAQYSYTFNGWSPEITAVTADVTYKATYTQTTNQYTVTWKNWDGIELSSNKVDYGTVPSYSGETPTKAGDAQHTYNFSGWSPEIVAVTENATYTAQFTDTINTYTVTWVDEDGTVLETDENVEYGTTPSYDGETPTKEGDAQYTYSFKGWSQEITAVTGDITYRATYTQTVNKYTVTWKNGDETILEQNVAYGKIPVYSGETPTKKGNAQYTYTFSGWAPEVVAVTGDATYTAQFTSAENTYTVTWKNADGTVLETDENVAYGTKPSYDGAEPTKASDAQYTYTFSAWKPEITENTIVESNVIYTATYKETVNTYTVTWVDEDGTELEKDEKVAYGKTPTYDGKTPTKAADADYTYSFAGWSPEVKTVTGDATYTATFTSTAIIKHKVTFDANGGEGTMNPQIFVEGESTPLSANAFTRAHYDFASWNTAKDGSGATYTDQGALSLTADLTLYAQWRHADGWFTDETGKTYYKEGEKAYTSEWQKIDQKTYYFNADGYVVTGIQNLTKDEVAGRYVFDENGIFLADKNGVYESTTDTYWLEKGRIVEYAGLQKTVDASGHIHYYYFGEDGKAVKNGTYKVAKNNDLKLPCFNYVFDADGVIVHDDDTAKNGICEGDGSKYYYYIDGVKVGIGLFAVGSDYYYARTSNGEIVRDRSYWISQTNGLPVESGMYKFDADGKMLRTGFVEESGSTYYYQNGEIVKGFTKIGEDYYFFNAGSGKLYKNITLWVADHAEYGITGGMYYFGADGKMVIPAPKNGLVTENGHIYYYIDGVKQRNGLYEIDGEYYFAKYSGELAVSESVYVETTVLSGNGQYGFDANGKLIKNGFIQGSDGYTYYYSDGVRAKGFTKIGDDYYLFNAGSGKMYKNGNYWVSDNTEYGIVGGVYTFGSDGRMEQKK